MESTLIKFNDDTKLGIFASSLEDRIRNQNDLDKVKKWRRSDSVPRRAILSIDSVFNRKESPKKGYGV